MGKPSAIPAVLLVVVGLSQMAGNLAGVDLLSGIAAATAAAPAPKVFSAVRGLETFSTRFDLEWTDANGTRQSQQLTPQLYSQIRGPYNRRNVYGAVVAYGPVLSQNPQTQELFNAVTRYAMCGSAPLLRELGIDPETANDVAVRYTPVGNVPAEIPLLLTVPCP